MQTCLPMTYCVHGTASRAPHKACSGVWATSAACLAMGALGCEERAALLAGLFLNAGVQVPVLSC